MPPYLPLRIVVVVSALFSLGGLAFLLIHTAAYGKKTYFSAPRAGALRGVVYAFGQGMMPWEKESARLHLPTFFGGIIYHTAIFASILYLFWLVFLPGLARALTVFRALLAIGAAAGLALLLKRVVKSNLRRLSCPDDFAANLFVDLFLMLALLHTYRPQLEPVLLAAATLLFIYIPLGKIRHCFFFFYTRILFGIFFGRRGVFPAGHRS